ncbi:MAG: hypothetical protein D6763_08975 [Alphaproteobacteria bacterium]|nr:MAG: hypothetical protein D6763_08975 [Alphaproteobacteria bacterium]
MVWTSRFSDSFTEATDTWLTSHTPDTGSGWSFVDGPTNEGRVYAADGTLGHAFDGNLDARIYSAEIAGTWAAKQKAEAVGVGNSNSKKKVAVRCGQTATVGRCYEAYHSSGDKFIRLYRRDSPSSVTQIGSQWDNTVSSGDVIGIVADGSSISVEVNGVTKIGPVTDSTYGDGSPGVVLEPTVTSSGIDDFEGFDEAVGGGATLGPADGNHGHAADPVVLGQVHGLGVARAAHDHPVESATFAQTHVVGPGRTLHGHTADSGALTSGDSIVVQPAAHQHGADLANLGQGHFLGVASARSLHLGAAAVLVAHSEILVADAHHDFASANTTFNTGTTGVPNERMIIPGPPARILATGADHRTLSSKR